MTPMHCGLPMLQVYSRSSTADRFELALTTETVESLHQCEHCGAKQHTCLEQVVVSSPKPSGGDLR